MSKQPDKDQFEMAMYKEVQSMFDNDIWTKVTRTSGNVGPSLKNGTQSINECSLPLMNASTGLYPSLTVIIGIGQLCL